jgi:hypothetical protein
MQQYSSEGITIHYSEYIWLEGEVMDKVKLYLKYRKKSYLLYTALFVTGFIIVIFIFGPPKYYVVPILSMIMTCGIFERVGYKQWKKDRC